MSCSLWVSVSHCTLHGSPGSCLKCRVVVPPHVRSDFHGRSYSSQATAKCGSSDVPSGLIPLLLSTKEPGLYHSPCGSGRRQGRWFFLDSVWLNILTLAHSAESSAVSASRVLCTRYAVYQIARFANKTGGYPLHV